MIGSSSFNNNYISFKANLIKANKDGELPKNFEDGISAAQKVYEKRFSNDKDDYKILILKRKTGNFLSVLEKTSNPETDRVICPPNADPEQLKEIIAEGYYIVNKKTGPPRPGEILTRFYELFAGLHIKPQPSGT